MKLIDRILSEENIKAAIKAVRRNKGAAGVDKMPVEELENYFYEHGREIRLFKCNMTDEDIFKVANSRLGWYRRCSWNVVNFLLFPKVLAMPNRKRRRPGLIDPLAYYLS